MVSAWPKRILFGRLDRTLRNGRKMGIPHSQIRYGFRPGTQAGENVSRRPLRARFHQRPTGDSVAASHPAEVRRPAGCTIALQVKDVVSGTSQRELRETLPEAARRREIDSCAGLATGPMGPVCDGPAGNTSRTGPPRRKFRLTDRSIGSD
jgi:hypothetical protein